MVSTEAAWPAASACSAASIAVAATIASTACSDAIPAAPIRYAGPLADSFADRLHAHPGQHPVDRSITGCTPEDFGQDGGGRHHPVPFLVSHFQPHIHRTVNRGGAGGDEAGQHVPCRQIRHGRRDDTGEGRPDGWVLEVGNDIAGKHAQVGAEIPVRPA